MSKIPVYKAEINDGLQIKIESSASIAYDAVAEFFTPTDDILKAKLDNSLMSQAGLDDGDLFFVKSILASTNWNGNDDVFLPHETWRARFTPVHKPDNFNHDEKVIIGHMVDSWAITPDGKIIPNDTSLENLPDFYHLVNGSVIYKTWRDDEFRKAVADLITKIKSGNAFVSMECLFRGFDYGIQNASGEHKILPRNEETAFLTKYLRSYGGAGEYKDYKIGRILRDLTFSGKGYVDKPANPHSVVFSNASIDNFSCAREINPLSEPDGVIIPCIGNDKTLKEIRNMADDTKHLDSQIAELKAELKAALAENKILAEASGQASVTKLEAQVVELNAIIATLEADKKAADEVIATSAKALEDKTAEIEVATASSKEVSDKLAELQAKSTATLRKTQLVAAGQSDEEADKLVIKFADLDDDAFAGVLSLVAKKEETPDEKKAREKAEKANAEKIASEANLEEVVDGGEAALAGATGGAEDELTGLRTALAGFVESRLIGKKKFQEIK